MRIPCGTEPRAPSLGAGGSLPCADQHVSSWRRSNALHAFAPGVPSTCHIRALVGGTPDLHQWCKCRAGLSETRSVQQEELPQDSARHPP